MFRSLYGKLTASHLGLIIITVIALAMLFSYLITDYFYRTREAELVNKGFEVGMLMEEYFSGLRSGTTMEYTLEGVSLMLDAHILAIDSRGRVIAVTHRFRRWMDESLAEMLDFGKVLENQVEVKRGYHSLFDGPMISAGIPIGSSDNILGAVFLFSSVQIIDEMASSVRTIMLYAGLGAGLIAIFVGVILSRSIAKPLVEMKHAVGKMTKGDFDVKVKRGSKDEVDELAKAFNTLSLSLKHSITELSHEKDKLEHIVKNMSEGVLAVDSDNRIVLTNSKASQMLNIPEKIGLPLPTSDVFKEICKIIENVKDTGEEEIAEVHLPSGTALLVYGSPLSEQGEGVVLVLHDITELNEAEKLRQEFVGNISHELRAPLTIIQGYAEAILDKVAKDTDTENRYLLNILNESKRLNKLVSELLDLSQIQAGGKQPVKIKISLKQIISRVLDTFEGKSQEKELEFLLDIDKDLPKIEVDPDMIHQLLVNLISNATRYSPKKGIIKIAAGVKGDYIEVSISDNGPGISEQNIHRIWERFFKGDPGRSRDESGTGLGLAIVKTIVEAHGGKVSAESVEGEGATFKVLLPK